MSDVFTKAKRSEVMSQIKGQGNLGTELRLVALLRLHGFTGWRRHADLIGRPDFVFRKKRLAIFVDGCFWHCCPKCGNWPKNNASFWRTKLEGNKKRDRLVTKTLKSQGWIVIRIWEHDLEHQQSKVMQRIGVELAKLR